jgi:hypothetical protein
MSGRSRIIVPAVMFAQWFGVLTLAFGTQYRPSK